MLLDKSNVQLIGNIGTFDPHDAFLGAAIAKKIDAPIPYDALIDNFRPVRTLFIFENNLP